VLDAEPEPATTIGATGLDELAETFADMVDLKRVFAFGHSSGVAELAADAAR
jgi:hypothetical protein